MGSDWSPRPAVPYEPGNLAALQHGARSPRMVAPIAERLAGELVSLAPWCGRPAFAAEVQAWAWSEARCRLLRAFLDEHGLLDAEGEPRSALAELHRAENTAARTRQQLGLSPASWARLFAAFRSAGEDPDGAVEALKAVGREILEAREDGGAG